MKVPQLRIPRPLIVLLVVVLVFVVLELTGATAWLGADRLRAWMDQAGVWGPPLFLGLFAVLALLQVPTLILVAAAPFLFEPVPGFIFCVIGGNVAVNVGFALVRRLGGEAEPPADGTLLARAFGMLTTHPIRAVALIRLFAFMFPPVTATLALTPLRARDHAIGSFIGLIPALAAFMGLTGALLQ